MKAYLYRLATDQINTPLAEVFKCLLWIFSLVYGLAVRTILFSYALGLSKKQSLSKPVISVGNITLGGTGKTPVVELLARYLRAQNARPAVLTRGYMNENHGQKKISGHFSDEASQLTESLSDALVVVGVDRFESGRKALRQHPVDVFLLDDGFQHWRLSRDMDVVVLDASRPFGNGHLLPRGILREPLTSLRRASLFILTKTDLGQKNIVALRQRLTKINPQAPIFETIHGPVDFVDLRTGHIKSLSCLQRKLTCSFCGIGDPVSFEYYLKNLGADLRKSFNFMDHHVYRLSDVQTIVKFCREHWIHTLVTTQKDSVKIKPFLKDMDEHIEVLSLRIKIWIIEGEDEFFKRISDVLGR